MTIETEYKRLCALRDAWKNFPIAPEHECTPDNQCARCEAMDDFTASAHELAHLLDQVMAEREELLEFAQGVANVTTGLVHYRARAILAKTENGQ